MYSCLTPYIVHSYRTSCVINILLEICHTALLITHKTGNTSRKKWHDFEKLIKDKKSCPINFLLLEIFKFRNCVYTLCAFAVLHQRYARSKVHAFVVFMLRVICFAVVCRFLESISD